MYYGMIRYLDDAIGDILRTLDETGLADNTIVIFTADHGDYAGEHGLMLKSGTFYDSMTRVPLIVSWPGGLEGRATRDELVSNIDIMPTIASLSASTRRNRCTGDYCRAQAARAVRRFLPSTGQAGAHSDVGPAQVPRLHGSEPGGLLPPDARPQRRGQAKDGPDDRWKYIYDPMDPRGRSCTTWNQIPGS